MRDATPSDVPAMATEAVNRIPAEKRIQNLWEKGAELFIKCLRNQCLIPFAALGRIPLRFMKTVSTSVFRKALLFYMEIFLNAVMTITPQE
jgi:hypothetical protein